MYDPEKSLEIERRSQESWDHYQDVVDAIGEDNSYSKWFKSMIRACDALDEITSRIEEFYGDEDEEQALIQKREELLAVVKASIKIVYNVTVS